MVGAIAPLTAVRGSIVREIAVGAARDAAAANILANAADQGDVLASAFAEEAQELLGCAGVRRARAARMRHASAEAATLGLDALASIGADAALLEDREADRVEGSVIQGVREMHSPGVFGYVSPEEQRLLNRKSKLERMTSGQLESAFHSMLTRMYDSAANYGAEGDDDDEVADDTIEKIGVAADIFGGDLPAVFGDGCYGAFWDIFKPSSERLTKRLERKRGKLAKVEAKLEELEDADKGGLRVKWLRGRVRRLEKSITRIKGKLVGMGVSAAKVAHSQVDADQIERAETEKVRESVDPDGEMSEAYGAAYGADEAAEDLADEDLMAAIEVFGLAPWRGRKLRRRVDRLRDRRMRARNPRKRRRITRKIHRLRRRKARLETPRGRGLWARRRAWARAGKPMAKMPMKARHVRYLQERRIRAAARRAPPRGAYAQPMYTQETASYPAAPATMPQPPMPYNYPSYDEMQSTVAMPQASPPEPTEFEAQDIGEGPDYENYPADGGGDDYGYNVEDDPTFAAELEAMEDEYGLDDDGDDDILYGDDSDLLGDDDEELVGDDDEDDFGAKRDSTKAVLKVLRADRKAARKAIRATKKTERAWQKKRKTGVAPGEAPPGGGPDGILGDDDDDIIYGDDSDLLGDLEDPDNDLIGVARRAEREEQVAVGVLPVYGELATPDEEAGRQVFVGFFHRRRDKHGGANFDTDNADFGGFWDNIKTWWSNLTSKGQAKAQAAAQQHREVSAARREARKPMDPAVAEWRSGLKLSKKERRKLGRKAARAARGQAPRAERGALRIERGRGRSVKQAEARFIQDDGGWAYQQNPDGSIQILAAPPAGEKSVGMTYAPGSSVETSVSAKFGPHPGSATVGAFWHRKSKTFKRARKLEKDRRQAERVKNRAAKDVRLSRVAPGEAPPGGGPDGIPYGAMWTGPRGGQHRAWTGPRGVRHHVRVGPQGRRIHHRGPAPYTRRRPWRRRAGWAMPRYAGDEYGEGLFSTLIASGMSNRDKASFLAKELDGAIKKFGPESQIATLLKARLDDSHEDARALGPDSASPMDEDEDLDFDEIEAGMKGSFSHYG